MCHSIILLVPCPRRRNCIVHCAGTTVNLCLAGLVAAVRVTSLLSMDMLRNTFVTTVARFTQLHAPASMALKHAQAFRALLVIADENGNHLGVGRCNARWSPC